VDIGAYETMRAAEHAHCVVCGAANPTGLQLEFAPRERGVVSAWFTGNPALEGYPGLLHGGIIGALVDGAMTNCLFSLGITAVTAELSVRYVEGVRADYPAEVTAWWLRSRGRLYAMQAEIRQDGRIVVRASGKFMDKSRAHEQPQPIQPGG
jgi:acyl-coenzyme A thioesterase PaaI-like protein